LIYVTFAAMLNARVYVIAVDYNRYIILKFCSFELGKRKQVNDKMNFLKLTAGFYNGSSYIHPTGRPSTYSEQLVSEQDYQNDMI